MPDVDDYIRKLSITFPMREPLLKRIITHMEFPSESCGLDVGCGTGHVTLMLADALGEEGQIVGIDQSAGLLAYAQELASRSRFNKRISFKQGYMYPLPFNDNEFDWIWSADCAGYPAEPEPLSLIREMMRVVRPGGKIIFLSWSSQNLLPGHPLFEARLNDRASSLSPILREREPDTVFMRIPGRFREAGLEDTTVETFVQDIQAPLGNDTRMGLAAMFEMLWEERITELSKQDRKEYDRLCGLSSPECLLNETDYYGFFTYTVIMGRLPE